MYLYRWDSGQSKGTFTGSSIEQATHTVVGELLKKANDEDAFCLPSLTIKKEVRLRTTWHVEGQEFKTLTAAWAYVGEQRKLGRDMGGSDAVETKYHACKKRPPRELKEGAVCRLVQPFPTFQLWGHPDIEVGIVEGSTSISTVVEGLEPSEAAVSLANLRPSLLCREVKLIDSCTVKLIEPPEYYIGCPGPHPHH